MAEEDVPLKTQVTVQRSNRFLLTVSVLVVLLIVVAVGTYTWYALHASCDVKAVEEASAILISEANMYDRVYQSAINAFPTTLDSPLVTMQQILADTQEVVVPACMQTAKKELLNYMGVVIRALRAFAAREAAATIRGLVATSNTHYDNFITELEAVNKCAPYCFP